ncbi:calponin homolog OV9M-like [Dreissena polymorpha]|uniref:calponin homolog OV9M-like n=1 Tax=Dreissena polymorpha TaxID=45954 RepID=UPI00226450CD|nr:calponin homolog OV9M-like [Dreissena polymorpha]
MTNGTSEKPKEKTKKFSKKQLRASDGLLTLQTGTNQFATQKGMSFGAVRHGADIKADDLDPQGNTLLTQQAATNRFATQKGMSFGAVRHGVDIRSDDMVPEGSAELSQQMATNRFATQKGMSFGAVRHGADIRWVPTSLPLRKA